MISSDFTNDIKNILEKDISDFQKMIDDILPGNNRNAYTSTILDKISKDIIARKVICPTSEYWIGYEDGMKYVTISKEPENMKSGKEISEILSDLGCGFTTLNCNLTITYFYDNILGKSGNINKCIVFIYKSTGHVFLEVFTWKDDDNPEFFIVDQNDIDMNANQEWDAVPVVSFIVSSSLNNPLHSPKLLMEYLTSKKYRIEKHISLKNVDVESRYIGLYSYIKNLKK